MGKERNWVSGEHSAFKHCQIYWYARKTPLWSAAISPFGLSLHSDSSVASRLKGLNYNGDKRVSKCLRIWQTGALNECIREQMCSYVIKVCVCVWTVPAGLYTVTSSLFIFYHHTLPELLSPHKALLSCSSIHFPLFSHNRLCLLHLLPLPFHSPSPPLGRSTLCSSSSSSSSRCYLLPSCPVVWDFPRHNQISRKSLVPSLHIIFFVYTSRHKENKPDTRNRDAELVSVSHWLTSDFIFLITLFFIVSGCLLGKHHLYSLPTFFFLTHTNTHP